MLSGGILDFDLQLNILIFLQGYALQNTELFIEWYPALYQYYNYNHTTSYTM
jgi:hypothetical protein